MKTAMENGDLIFIVLYQKLEFVAGAIGVALPIIFPHHDLFMTAIHGVVTGVASFITVKLSKYAYRKAHEFIKFLEQWHRRS